MVYANFLLYDNLLSDWEFLSLYVSRFFLCSLRACLELSLAASACFFIISYIASLLFIPLFVIEGLFVPSSYIGSKNICNLVGSGLASAVNVNNWLGLSNILDFC